MTNQMDQEVEEARAALAWEFGKSVGVHLSGDPERASEMRDAAVDALIEAVRRQERERTKGALNTLNNYQLWPETRISQARAILARASEEAGNGSP